MMFSAKNKRKSRRQGIKVLRFSGFFLAVFVVTIGVLTLTTYKKDPGLISPLAKLKIYSQASSTPEKAEVENELKKHRISYKAVELSDNTFFLVQLDPSGDVILSSQKDIAKQISSLQVILTRLTMEGKAIKKLDLRYDKPIIVLK